MTRPIRAVKFFMGKEGLMNRQNTALVRTIITELMEHEDILEDTNIDAHDEYLQDEPNLEGNFLDMGRWCTVHECGTAACLAGWIAQDPRVRALGLTLEPGDDGNLWPYFEGEKGMPALKRLLGWHYMVSVDNVFAGHWRNSFAQGLHRFDTSARQEAEWAAAHPEGD